MSPGCCAPLAPCLHSVSASTSAGAARWQTPANSSFCIITAAFQAPGREVPRGGRAFLSGLPGWRCVALSGDLMTSEDVIHHSRIGDERYIDHPPALCAHDKLTFPFTISSFRRHDLAVIPPALNISQLCRPPPELVQGAKALCHRIQRRVQTPISAGICPKSLTSKVPLESSSLVCTALKPLSATPHPTQVKLSHRNGRKGGDRWHCPENRRSSRQGWRDWKAVHLGGGYWRNGSSSTGRLQVEE